MVKNAKGNSYLPLYAGQLPVLKRDGQERLHQAHLHISGTGRIGSSLAINLAGAGVGHISANDPQVVEPESLGSWAFMRPQDLGKDKVIVLWKYFRGRRHFSFKPLVEAAESKRIDPYLQRSQLVISCANTVQGRLAAEQKAIRYRKPVMQVAAYDGRERLGGLITLRLPENGSSACFGCYLCKTQEFPRGEGLLATVTSTLAAIASNIAIELLTGIHADFVRRHNLYFIDLQTYTVEALALKRRRECRVCGPN